MPHEDVRVGRLNGYDAFYQKLITNFDLATVTGFFSMEAIISNGSEQTAMSQQMHGCSPRRLPCLARRREPPAVYRCIGRCCNRL
jgi:hypothetical protein